MCLSSRRICFSYFWSFILINFRLIYFNYFFNNRLLNSSSFYWCTLKMLGISLIIYWIRNNSILLDWICWMIKSNSRIWLMMMIHMNDLSWISILLNILSFAYLAWSNMNHWSWITTLLNIFFSTQLIWSSMNHRSLITTWLNVFLSTYLAWSSINKMRRKSCIKSSICKCSFHMWMTAMWSHRLDTWSISLCNCRYTYITNRNVSPSLSTTSKCYLRFVHKIFALDTK